MSIPLSFGNVYLTENNNFCIICQDVIENDEAFTGHESTGENPHVYHIPCIGAWMQKNPTCPICHAAVDADSVFKQQNYKDRFIQTMRHFDYEGTANRIYQQAKPHIYTALPYILRGIVLSIPGYYINASENLCALTNYQLPLCALIPALKTVGIIAGGYFFMYGAPKCVNNENDFDENSI